VLQLVVTEELMRRHPEAGEGDLSWMRQAVVARDYCAAAARASGLPDAMRAAAPHGHRERAAEVAGIASVQAAAAEAVIGAAWLDLGREATEAAVREAFGPALDAAEPGARDPKTALQEEAQRRRMAVAYELTGTDGPPQRRTFASRALVDGRELGAGRGRSKQASEAAAAAEALRRLAETS
jgi:ribonuclease III